MVDNKDQKLAAWAHYYKRVLTDTITHFWSDKSLKTNIHNLEWITAGSKVADPNAS